VVSGWNIIVNKAGMPLRLYLKTARLSLGGDNRLLIVVEDGVASDYLLKQEGHREQVEQLIEEYIGKKVELTIQPLDSTGQFENKYIDLSKVINIEIEEEE
jgi:DNA polymerase-3 subunit gamma/tau